MNIMPSISKITKSIFGPVFEVHESFHSKDSLMLVQGEFLYIKGSNGSGKSTLLKLICGLFKPNSGRITIFEREPHKFPSVLKDVGVVVDGM